MIQTRKGRTHLVYGCMFSGKTTEGTRLLNRAKASGECILCLKWNQDSRHALISSHDGVSIESVHCESVDTLENDPPALNGGVDYTWILVDEGQFLKGLSEFCYRQNQRGIHVVVTALNHIADAQLSPWPEVSKLAAWAFCTQLTAICVLCKEEATCSRRIKDKSKDNEELIVDIGGADKYIATCRACYTKDIIIY